MIKVDTPQQSAANPRLIAGVFLRDYFAAQALHEFMAMAPRAIDQAQAQVIAEECYVMADAMLEARKIP